MSCFTYAGAEDLDSLIAQDDSIELSSDSESSSSSEDDLFGKTKKKKKVLGKRKKTAAKPQKKQRVDQPGTAKDKQSIPNSITEAIGILSSDDDDNELSLLVDDDPNRVLSETTRHINGTLCEIQFVLFQALGTSQ